MRRYEKKTYPAQTRDELVEQTCDLCGRTLKTKDYEVREAEIRVKVGERYPDGGTVVEREVDICLECVEEKVFPFLKSLGAKVYEEKINF
jgi:hypothetical protein